MSAPAVLQVAEDLYDELGVTQPADEQLGWPFLIFLQGLATALGRVPGLVRDTDAGPGWSSLMVPASAPDWALPWLAQFAGVAVRPTDDPSVSRSRIVTHAQFQRGTPAAMIAAGQATLTGTQLVRLYEADSSPYHLTVTTMTGETPDPVATEKAVRSQKPAGLILDYAVVDGTTWNSATGTWDAAAVTWDHADDL